MLFGILLAATIDCTGAFAPQTSEKALIAQFGKANVKRETVYVAEGGEEDGTVLFPNDPKRRVEIVWKQKKARQAPEWLRIADDSTWDVFGLRVGTPLADLVKRNGRDFRFSGFGWDYGGAITDLRGGELAKLGGKTCHVGMTIDVDFPENPTKAQEKALENVSGDRELTSSSPHLKKLKVRVTELLVSY
ncbi:MAG TPA: hypothetical protein VND45_12385 [Thermoanaerobaculia bacterium]|jgi:hypothetical protein|nr:hypothetical protein [Thermoanaerobaculia bacterium]